MMNNEQIKRKTNPFPSIHQIALVGRGPANDSPVPRTYANGIRLWFVFCVFFGATNSRICCKTTNRKIITHHTSIQWQFKPYGNKYSMKLFHICLPTMIIAN